MTTASLLTRHFARRAAQRGLRDDVLDFILAHGTEFHGAGATFLTVLRRPLPQSLRNGNVAQRATGWILVIGRTGELATCYRKSRATGFIRRQKLDSPDRWRREAAAA